MLHPSFQALGLRLAATHPPHASIHPTPRSVQEGGAAGSGQGHQRPAMRVWGGAPRARWAAPGTLATVAACTPGSCQRWWRQRGAGRSCAAAGRPSDALASPTPLTPPPLLSLCATARPPHQVYPDPVRVVSVGKSVEELVADPTSGGWGGQEEEEATQTEVPEAAAASLLLPLAGAPLLAHTQPRGQLPAHPEPCRRRPPLLVRTRHPSHTTIRGQPGAPD